MFFPSEVFAMDRFVSKRSSSSLNLDASSLDDVRAERAAITLSVWSELATSQAVAVRRTPQLAAALGNELFRTTSSSTTSFRMVSACSARLGGDQEKPPTGR